jgi:hypothetical protein
MYIIKDINRRLTMSSCSHTHTHTHTHTKAAAVTGEARKGLVDAPITFRISCFSMCTLQWYN